MERDHFSLSVGACRLCVGKPSVILRRLTWKWWSKGHLRCLVEAIKIVDQEKQATPKRELVMAIQVVFQINLLCKHWSKNKASQSHHDSALDHMSDSQIIWVKNGLYLWWLVFTKLIIGLYIAIEVINWNLCYYPLLQDSKGIIVKYMIISYLTSMRLVHIVYAS